SPRFWAERTRMRRARGAPGGRNGWRAAASWAPSRHLASVGDREARIVGKPEGNRNLAFGARLGRDAPVHHAFAPRLLHPLRHGLGREAEPAMGILFAQELKLMGRKVDDEEAALGPQHPRGLADGATTVVKKVQHLMDDDDIKGVARNRKIEDVALPDA